MASTGGHSLRVVKPRRRLDIRKVSSASGDHTADTYFRAPVTSRTDEFLTDCSHRMSQAGRPANTTFQ